jgi:hypothetical protein
MRLAVVFVLLVGCSTRPDGGAVASQTPERVHVVAAPVAPALAAPERARSDDQAALDTIEEQIQGQTMFCVATAHDCPSGFRCDDGACVAAL